uniref:Dynamin N-terminal domain-containing protein n=1 Tax=Palpitomonas bilix TaxID=652834 RepID=A0A7S3D2N8_9EUKA|mmetsp:Transcript_19546/g.50059  ORF Transcript_19546/g.50059 Transcript_19546/m.50059 type:complete len:700 (+) Transcript_19546:406-2505(+)
MSAHEAIPEELDQTSLEASSSERMSPKTISDQPAFVPSGKSDHILFAKENLLTLSQQIKSFSARRRSQGLAARLESLMSILDDLDSSIPTIVIFGQQSSGKTATLSALQPQNEGYVAGSMATRTMVIIHYSKKAEKIEFRIDNSEYSELSKRTFETRKEAEEAIRAVLPEGKLSADTVLTCVFPQRADRPDQIFIDIPGMIPAKMDANAPFFSRIREDYLSRPECTIVHVVDGSLDPDLDISTEFLKTVPGAQKRTLKVITHVDKIAIDRDSHSHLDAIRKESRDGSLYFVANKVNDNLTSEEEEKQALDGIQEALNGVLVSSDKFGRAQLAKDISDELAVETRKRAGKIDMALFDTGKKLEGVLSIIGKEEQTPSWLRNKLHNSIIEALDKHTGLQRILHDVDESLAGKASPVVESLPNVDVVKKIIEKRGGRIQIKGTESSYPAVEDIVAEKGAELIRVLQDELFESIATIESLVLDMLSQVGKDDSSFESVIEEHVTLQVQKYWNGVRQSLAGELTEHLHSKMGAFLSCISERAYEEVQQEMTRMQVKRVLATLNRGDDTKAGSREARQRELPYGRAENFPLFYTNSSEDVIVLEVLKDKLEKDRHLYSEKAHEALMYSKVVLEEYRSHLIGNIVNGLNSSLTNLKSGMIEMLGSVQDRFFCESTELQQDRQSLLELLDSVKQIEGQLTGKVEESM